MKSEYIQSPGGMECTVDSEFFAACHSVVEILTLDKYRTAMLRFNHAASWSH